MRTALAVRYAYMAMGLYALAIVSVTTLTLGHLLPALIQLGIGYLLFSLGQRGGRLNGSAAPRWEDATLGQRPWPVWANLSVGLSALASAGVCATYYTGKAPAEVVRYLIEGRSLYGSYQAFNSELLAAGGGGGFSVYFALLVYVKVVLLVAVLRNIPQGGRPLRRELALIILAVGAQAYLGLARGTGLEFFELGTVLGFAILIRHRESSWPRWRSVATVIGIAAVLAVLYVLILAARGATASSLASGGDVGIDETGIGFALGAPLVGPLLRFYDYFGFGFHYVATYWSDIWLASPSSLVAGLFPLGHDLMGIDPKAAIGDIIEMGTHWHPDSVLLMSEVGLLGLLATFFLLGRFSEVLDRDTSLSSAVLMYFVFLQMVALPVGNFVWVDTANLVVIAGVAAFRILRWLATPAPRRPPSRERINATARWNAHRGLRGPVRGAAIGRGGTRASERRAP